MKQYNFAPLIDKRVDSHEVEQYIDKKQRLVVLFVTIPITLFILFLVFMMMADKRGTSGADWLIMLIPLSFVFLIGGGLWWALYRDARAKVLLKKFADINGLTFEYNIADPQYPGMYFSAGHDRKITELLRTAEGAEFGRYYYVTGSGRSRQEHNLGYAKFHLTRNLPNIVLDSKKNNFLGITNLPTTYSRDQRLQLEGNFNDFYTLYAPKEYERDVLYIFTPDVMQAFIDAPIAIDIEIVDNELYIYADRMSDMTNAKNIEQMMHLVDILGSKVENTSDRYSDERIGNFAQNIVADPGKRLKSSIGIVSIIVIIYFVINIVMNFLPFFNSGR